MINGLPNFYMLTFPKDKDTKESNRLIALKIQNCYNFITDQYNTNNILNKMEITNESVYKKIIKENANANRYVNRICNNKIMKNFKGIITAIVEWLYERYQQDENTNPNIQSNNNYGLFTYFVFIFNFYKQICISRFCITPTMFVYLVLVFV